VRSIYENDFYHTRLTKYFQGRVLELNTTPGNNLLVSCNQVRSLRSVNEIITKSAEYDNVMNFMIPKRRKELFNLCIKNEIYIFKLEQESSSKKLMIKEVFNVA